MKKDSLKILLVEDDEDDYVMTRDLLEEVEGVDYTLEWVSTVDEAFKLMACKHHDAYLVDYRLGGETGISLIRQTVKNGYKKPIILLTGQSDKEVDMEAMAAGASDYLVKGQINASMLERSIRYAIDRIKSEEQIHRMAYYDHLTNLPNRVLFKDRLQVAITQCKRFNRMSAVLFIDLDDFKRVNDSYGHSAGDQLLKEVSKNLLQSVRSSDSVSRDIDNDLRGTVARIGGDEFIILLNEITNVDNAVMVSKRILEAFTMPINVDGKEVYVRVSIGISIYPLDGEDSEILIKSSDAAMYYAKSQGKNNYQFFKKSMLTTSIKRLTLENLLHKALERDELLLHYQPQIDSRHGKVIGVEALMRWQHPERGLVPPYEFIPIAEETGLILPISEWLFKTACHQNKAWQRAGLNPIRVSVNLSRLHFKNYDLILAIKHALNESSLAPRWLELEITENIVIENIQSTLNILYELKAMGLSLAMDDFGTGYSSFAHLKKYPLNLLKIDRSFVKDITTDSDCAAIVTAIIAMAKSLHLSVIAEGVESEREQAFLQERGCYKIQGFLHSRPLPVDQITTFLKNNSPVNSTQPHSEGHVAGDPKNKI